MPEITATAAGKTAAHGNQRIGPRPVQVGLVGRGIQRSRTPAIHEAEGRAFGLDLAYRLFDVDEDTDATLPEILNRAEAEGYAGLNITFPFKCDVIEHLDEMSDAAGRVGAVNTVVFRDGKRRGHNTDLWGFAESFRRGLPGADMSCVLLIGAGGAGKAVGHALRDLGAARIVIADQKPDAAATLADEINRTADVPLAEPAGMLLAAAAEASGIVNATPMGMAKLPGTPIDPDLLEARHWIADIVYFPLETEFLKAARARNCQTLNGSGMAVFQAVRAFNLFTGLNADAARMRATFERLGR